MDKEAIDEWQQLTKNCQRYLTGKSLKHTHTKQESKKLIIAPAINDGKTSLNSELNAKFDFDSMAVELNHLGLIFNKSLCM